MTEQAKHSRLPWLVERFPAHESGCRRIYQAGERTPIEAREIACTVGLADDAEDRANADLIVGCANACGKANPANPVAAAEALPDLLAACEGLAPFLSSYKPDAPLTATGVTILGEDGLATLQRDAASGYLAACCAARAAIAKAKREAPR